MTSRSRISDPERHDEIPGSTASNSGPIGDMHPIALEIACRHDLETSTGTYQDLALELISMAGGRLELLTAKIHEDDAVTAKTVKAINGVILVLSDAIYVSALGEHQTKQKRDTFS